MGPQTKIRHQRTRIWKPNLALWIGPILSYAFMLAHSLTHSAIAPNYIILLKTNEKRNPNIKPIKKEKKTFIAQNNFYPILTHHPPIAHFMYGRNWNKLNRPACSCLYLSYLFFFFFFYKKTRISIGLGMERSLGQNKIF